MNSQMAFNITIVIWLFAIERRMKLIDLAFRAIGLVLDRLYQKAFGKERSDEKDK